MASHAYFAAAEPGAEGVYPPPPEGQKKALLKNLAAYKEMYDNSIEHPDAFWSNIAERYHWESKGDPDAIFKYNYDRTKGPVSIKWFEGWKTNMCYNCLDRNIAKGLGNNVAFFFEGNDPSVSSILTYNQLFARVCKFANALKARGVGKGDVVITYMPMVVELAITMLACARIGAIHSVVFGGFSAEALANRILASKCKLVVCADGTFRGDKFIALKQVTDDAIGIAAGRGHTVTCTIMAKNVPDGQGPAIPYDEARDCVFQEIEGAETADCPPVWVDAEDPLFFLYTSGSTGMPKGVVHTTGGYMVYAGTTHMHSFDYQPGDVFWCTADCGWITGHSYITYGPLLNGASSVFFEGVPTFPDAGRFWQICEKYQVTQFYTAPTAVRALQRYGDEYPNKYDLSKLRVLGSVGEPINPEAWLWYYNVIGKKKCYISDTWWQTETGGHCITGLPGVTPMKPGSASLPMFGIIPAILDKDGKEIIGPGAGYLVIKQAWPGQMRTLWGDHERYEQAYFSQHNGYYCTGDGARRDEHGYFWITGRVDDVINVSGHRIGTAEVEAALTRHPDVVEAAVVAIPHEVKGEGIYAYVLTREGTEKTPETVKSIKGQVRGDIGPFASPDAIHFAAGLPKTRSGKIMRRVLRKIASNETEFGDLSTIVDPSIIDALIATKPK